MGKWYFLLVLVLAVGCKNTTNKKAMKMDREDFKEILFALHHLEGRFDYSSFQEDSLSVAQKKEYDSVFSVHSIEKELFYKEYNRYVDFYIADLDTIYDELITEFQDKVDSIDNLSDINIEQKQQPLQPQEELKPIQLSKPTPNSSIDRVPQKLQKQRIVKNDE